jgi:rRNA maturation endonuclease Nob1
MSGYAVVFTNWKGGKYALAVPESWLIVVDNELKCYFPKYNAGKLIEKQAPVQTSWKLYTVRKISAKNITSYDDALRKESKAWFTLGLESDESEDEQLRAAKKAKRSADVSEKTKVEGFSGRTR